MHFCRDGIGDDSVIACRIKISFTTQFYYLILKIVLFSWVHQIWLDYFLPLMVGSSSFDCF